MLTITLLNGAGGIVEMTFDAEWMKIESAAPCMIRQTPQGRETKLLLDLDEPQTHATENKASSRKPSTLL